MKQIWELLLWSISCPWMYPEQEACELALKIMLVVWKGHMYIFLALLIYLLCQLLNQQQHQHISHSGDCVTFEMGERDGTANADSIEPMSPGHSLPLQHTGADSHLSHLFRFPAGEPGFWLLCPLCSRADLPGNYHVLPPPSSLPLWRKETVV